MFQRLIVFALLFSSCGPLNIFLDICDGGVLCVDSQPATDGGYVCTRPPNAYTWFERIQCNPGTVSYCARGGWVSDECGCGCLPIEGEDAGVETIDAGSLPEYGGH